jgi:hypothetical protein
MSSGHSVAPPARNEPGVTTKSQTEHAHRVQRAVRSARKLLVVLALSGLGGCTGATLAAIDESPDSPSVPSVDGKDGTDESTGTALSTDTLIRPEELSNEVIVDLLRDGTYRGPGYRLVNEEPFPSTVAPGKTIVLWVSEAGYPALARVSADHAGSEVTVPVGTVIVREVLLDDALDTLTVMVKMPKGAFPLGGDWWYAAADPDGKIRKHATEGTPLAGLLEKCGTCHLRRDRDAFLFGAPDGYVE